jgi:hypothetical protein
MDRKSSSVEKNFAYKLALEVSLLCLPALQILSNLKSKFFSNFSQKHLDIKI